MSNLSQAEIDSLLQGGFASTAVGAGEPGTPAYGEGSDTYPIDVDESMKEDISQYFTEAEIDALGEIGNICMGTSATTMNVLLGRKVTITTPQVALYRAENALAFRGEQFLAITVEFIKGLYGKNLLVLKDYDAALITDLLMGGQGDLNGEEIILTEIHLSAVSEVMNQMMGSAATAMSDMTSSHINISPPTVVRMDKDKNVGQYLDGATPVVRVSFDMEIEGLLQSKLLQIMSVDMAKELIAPLMPVEEVAEKKREKEPAQTQPSPPTSRPSPPTSQPSPPASRPSPPAPRRSIDPSPVHPDGQGIKSVKPARFESFDDTSLGAMAADMDNFDLINDIPLQVTVELGKTKKSLSDVLGFGVGSIIVLDKQAGELVEVIVNGKRIARGEVVVIDENYGVRITELLKG